MKSNKTYEQPTFKISSILISTLMLPESMIVDPGTSVDDEAAKERANDYIGDEHFKNSLW